MDFYGPPRQERHGQPATVSILLSLYLLVLAFFILLNSISQREDSKSNRVMEGLTSAFASPAARRPQMFSADVGDVVGAFVTGMSELFETAIPAVKLRVVNPGRVLEVSMHPDVLYFNGEARLRPAHGAFFDRLIGSLATSPDGFRYRMEFIINSEYGGRDALPVGESLEMARAGAFAREMLARGAPPQALLVGMERRSGAAVRMYFRVIEQDEPGPAPSAAHP